MKTVTSDGTTASYYELPLHTHTIFELMTHRNMNHNIGRIFMGIYGVVDPSVSPTFTQLQQLISDKNMNAQYGEIFRSCYRYGQSSHSTRLRDARKIRYYAEAECDRVAILASGNDYDHQHNHQRDYSLATIILKYATVEVRHQTRLMNLD